MARGEFNPAQGDAKLEVGGKKYLLRYTLRSLAELQARLGGERFNGLLDGGANFADFGLLRDLLHCGVRYHHPAADIDEVMDDIGLADLPLLSKAIADAFAGAFPAAKEGGDAGPTNPPPSKAKA